MGAPSYQLRCKPESVSTARRSELSTTTIYLGPTLLHGLMRPTWD